MGGSLQFPGGWQAGGAGDTLTRRVWLCDMVTSQHPRSLRSGAEDLRCPGCGAHLTSRRRCWHPPNLAKRAVSLAGHPAFPRDGGMDPVLALGASGRGAGSLPALSSVSVPAVPQFPHAPSGGMERGLLLQGSSPPPLLHPAHGKAGFSQGWGPSVAPAVAQGRAVGFATGNGCGRPAGSTAGCSGSGCWELLDETRREVRGPGRAQGDGDMGRWPRAGSRVEQALTGPPALPAGGALVEWHCSHRLPRTPGPRKPSSGAVGRGAGCRAWDQGAVLVCHAWVQHAWCHAWARGARARVLCLGLVCWVLCLGTCRGSGCRARGTCLGLTCEVPRRGHRWRWQPGAGTPA